MKLIYKLTFFIFVFAFNKAIGQSSGDCKIDGPLFVKVEQPPIFKGSLQDYFEKEFSEKIKTSNGNIIANVLVDTSGKSCCMNLTNNSNLSNIEIRNSIRNMNNWLPAKENNHSVSFSALLEIKFINSKLLVNYLNGKYIPIEPIINTNTANYPDIIKEKKSKAIWKLWNFKNSMIPSNLSRSIALDSNGVVWYCTDNGIVRIVNDYWQIYNGINTKELLGKNKNTSTIGLAIDKSNNVWINTSDKIIKYDGKKWTKFDTTNSPLELVRKINVDRNGIIWFSSFRGLIKYDGKNWKKYTTTNTNISSDNVSETFLDNSGTLWISTDKGINKLKDEIWTVYNSSNSKLPDNNVTAITGDNKGNIWAGCGTKKSNFLIKLDISNNINFYTAAPIWNITVEENTNNMWLSTNGAGLVLFNGKEFAFFNDSNSIIPNNTVTDMVIDKNGDKWISTFGGLVFTNKK